ncbi:S-adenosyl-L-methionine-dependent methyltransferase [Phellopilus nigrolimitatus]|nr:S-adenosyl-L-methionine-dependent methyltransferase [Phellopilus nigrolimitatus]
MNNGNQGLLHRVNGAMPPDDSDSDNDSSDSVSSMSTDEIEEYFVEIHNRRFHSHGNGPLPYPLPVDELEGQRSDRVHELLKTLLHGRNYCGPVQNTLNTSDEGRRVRALDICTGNGTWVDEMAAEFPHVKVYGLDIENVQYEVHDINAEPLRWAEGRFDLVHMRHVNLALRNYPAVLREVARVLCPGGLFLSGEWVCEVRMDDGSEARTAARGMSRFFQSVANFVNRRRLFSDTARIPQLLTTNGNFEQVVTRQHHVALDDSNLGNRAKRMTLDFGDSLRGLFIESGLTAVQVETVLQGLRSDIEHVEGMELIYQTVHARRNHSNSY